MKSYEIPTIYGLKVVQFTAVGPRTNCPTVYLVVENIFKTHLVESMGCSQRALVEGVPCQNHYCLFAGGTVAIMSHA